MTVGVHEVPLSEIAALRAAFRAEHDHQIVHHAIHDRAGWTREYALVDGGRTVGYASVAVDGPWLGRPTFYEQYIVPEARHRSFTLFEAFLDATRPPAFEVQTSDALTTTLALTFALSATSERIIFRDDSTTAHEVPGARLRALTSEDELRVAAESREGGGQWVLEVDGSVVGSGGIMFHYNAPYGDLHMEVEEAARGRGYGAFLVQELKRVCRELGQIPGARCVPTNAASRRTLQRAGMLPCAHILVGEFRHIGVVEDRTAPIRS